MNTVGTRLDFSQLHKLLSSQLKLGCLMPALVDIVLELTGAQRGFLMLADGNGPDDFSIHTARSSDKTDLSKEEFKGSSSVIRKVLQQRESVYVPSLPTSVDFSAAASVKTANLQSVICIPLWHSQKGEAEQSLLGLLYIDSSLATSKPLSEEHLQVMQALANHVAMAIENGMLFEELQRKSAQIELLNQQLERKVELQEGKIVGMQIVLEETQRELSKRYGQSNIIGK